MFCKVSIFTDCGSYSNPLEWDDGWKLVLFRNRDDFDDWFSRDNRDRLVLTDPETRKLKKRGNFSVVSKYEHSSVVYTLFDKNPKCRFDSTQYAGVLYREDAEIPWHQFERQAERFLQNYTDFCNGEVYSIRVTKYSEMGEEDDNFDWIYGCLNLDKEVEAVISGLDLKADDVIHIGGDAADKAYRKLLPAGVTHIDSLPKFERQLEDYLWQFQYHG